MARLKEGSPVGDTTVGEAGRIGGKRVLEKYGKEYFSNLAQKSIRARRQKISENLQPIQKTLV